MKLRVVLVLCFSMFISCNLFARDFDQYEQYYQMLKIGKYDFIEKTFNDAFKLYQENDSPETEDEIFAILNVFERVDPELERYLTDWVKQKSSGIAYLVRGTYYQFMGLSRRGVKYSSETEAAQFRDMFKYFQLAETDYKKVLDISPKIHITYIHLLNMTKYSGSKTDATKWLAAGKQVSPNSLSLHQTYANILMPRWGGLPDDLGNFLSSLEASGADQKVINIVKAVQLYDQGFYEYRKKNYEKSLELHQKSFEITGKYGFLAETYYPLLRLNRKDEAFSALKRVVAMRPHKSKYQHLLGQQFNQRKRYKEAITALTRAINLGRSGGEPYFNRGSCYDCLRQFGKAVKDYRKGIAVDPDNASVQHYRSRVQQLLPYIR